MKPLKEKLYIELVIKMEKSLLSTSDPIFINNYKIMRAHNMRLAARIHNSTLRPYVYKE